MYVTYSYHGKTLDYFQLRHVLETSLAELREAWMKRVVYEACVCCSCDRACRRHAVTRCSDAACLHFLNLDDCISNHVSLTQSSLTYTRCVCATT